MRKFVIMSKKHTKFYEKTLNNVRKIMQDKHLTQLSMGELIGVKESSMSKIFNGQASFTLDHLSKLASSLAISEIDIIKYGEEPKPEDPVEAILQIKLKKDKKDQVLKLVFGENNIEILNK